MAEWIWTATMKLAAPFMSGFVMRGIKPTEALTIFRRAGGAIRTQDWFRAYKVVTSQVAHEETIKGMRATTIIHEDRFVDLGKKYRDPYVMRGEYEATNVLTGQRETRWASVGTDFEMSRRDWEEELEAAVMRTETSPTLRDFSWLTLNPERSHLFS